MKILTVFLTPDYGVTIQQMERPVQRLQRILDRWVWDGWIEGIELDVKIPKTATEQELQWVFGSDSRVSVANAYPFKTMIHFSNNCSGIWIGHHTIMTAAHCDLPGEIWTNFDPQI